MICCFQKSKNQHTRLDNELLKRASITIVMCYRYLRADSWNNKMNLHPKNKIRQGIFFQKKLNTNLNRKTRFMD